MFGKIDNIEDQVAFSQYLQAEGLRYAIEANRRRAFNNSGCIIWQFNEPYPNLCCTNLVDYFEKPKTAYFAVKQAYEAFNPNMKYEKTVYQAGEEFFAELYLTADKSGEYVYEVECITEDGVTKLNYNVKVESNGKSVKVGEIAFKVPQKGSMWFNLRAKDSSGNLSQNKIMLLIGVGVDCHRADVNRYIKELRD
jgi:beta-mannosidase